ncbi:DUF3592 domain-containing protein [Sphaerisporangium sp. NBC_01403]|uniref:DUF3592 domain-containing protein n=1 Tax=Sphaerisporangium sp. NBC_01403 TaxID=2903599 RepID=UPI00324D0250
MSDNAAFIVGTIGAIMAVLGGAVILNARDFRRRGRRGRAQVVRLHAVRAGGTRRERRLNSVYHPVLRFTTEDGEQIEAESPVGSNPPPARPGDRVPIIYDPADPTQVRIDSVLGGGALLGALLAGFGLLLLVLGVRAGVAFL